MSSLNMCVKLALCLVLAATTDSFMIKPQQFPLPPEGITMEITLKNKSNKAIISAMTIDIDEPAKKVLLSTSRIDESPKKLKKTDFLPNIENRHGIRVGTCPGGYLRRGGFCFPNNDY